MKIPVFFNERMVCLDNDSYSPSAGKPAAVVKEWQSLFSEYIEVLDFMPATVSELALAHDRRFVESVLQLERANGFGNKLASVADTLPYTSGAMLEAAKEALANKKVAVAPVSGFHHACYNKPGGFCTFNGLMVTACWLLEKDPAVKRVGILDLDQHYGNGTDDIIKVLGVSHKVSHLTGGLFNEPAGVFIQHLPERIHDRFSDCDVLLYQAGADPHIDDPLGGWMTTEELTQRDRLVFEACAAMGLPVAWDLAGGYQQPLHKVLDIHNNTMAACLSVFA